MTRANTPASAPLRRFLSFSPWRAPARLRLESQISLENPSPAGAKQFCSAEMCPGKEGPAGNTCRISKGRDAAWAHFCPAKPCLSLSTDGILFYYSPLSRFWQQEKPSLPGLSGAGGLHRRRKKACCLRKAGGKPFSIRLFAP